MSTRRFTTLTAALIAAAGLTVATASAATAAAAQPQAGARPDTFIGKSYGYGATLADAQWAADSQIYADYYDCKLPFYLIADGQLADGSWWAEVAANGCQGYV
jgi:hypothetical protein